MINGVVVSSGFDAPDRDPARASKLDKTRRDLAVKRLTRNLTH
jgi:hypothetical protein